MCWSALLINPVNRLSKLLPWKLSGTLRSVRRGFSHRGDPCFTEVAPDNTARPTDITLACGSRGQVPLTASQDGQSRTLTIYEHPLQSHEGDAARKHTS